MDRDLLRTWLHRHTPADKHEQECLQQVLAALNTGGDCFSRHWFTPGHITASAFVMSPDQRHMLLISHRDFGLWMQPGGHLDPVDSSVLEAAKRELVEEAGLSGVAQPDWASGILDVDVHQVPAGVKHSEPAHQHFDIRFAFLANTAEVTASSDAKDARWFLIDDLVKTSSTDASVRRAAIRLQRRSHTL